jgi:hypothetical protein
MNGCDYLDGLNLHNDLAIYDRIGEKPGMNVDLFVDNRNSLLADNTKSRFSSSQARAAS